MANGCRKGKGCRIDYMEPTNITPLVKKYGPGYIAKSKKTGRVVAHAKRIDVLFNKTKDRKDIVIKWIPKSGARYVFKISI